MDKIKALTIFKQIQCFFIELFTNGPLLCNDLGQGKTTFKCTLYSSKLFTRDFSHLIKYLCTKIGFLPCNQENLGNN